MPELRIDPTRDVLAVDPGSTTGIARWRLGEWRAWSDPVHSATVGLHMLLDRDPPQELVLEKFTITLQTVKKTRAGSMEDIEQCGALKYLAQCYDIPVVEQSPSDAMNFATDAKLRAIEWWTPGADHPRDASRHLLMRLCRLGAVDLSGLLGMLESE